MNATETLDRLRLARTSGVGPVTYRRMLRAFPTAGDAIAALPQLGRMGRISWRPEVPSLGTVQRELDQLHRMGGRVLILGEPDYPPLLALLDDAPPAIAVLGDPAVLSRTCVGLVGARNASANGRRMAELLAADLALAGYPVVSGLARGVDAAAHEGALRTGATVAAVAGGLDRPYPEEHATLQRRIAEGGAVVAEAPLGTAPRDRHFPRRNRIIAGLSLGVVVVEAALRSGSLITAEYAQNAGRELFAVPGSPLDPRCHGSNDLIRQGAHLTESVRDVRDNLPRVPAPPLLSGLVEAQDWGFRTDVALGGTSGSAGGGAPPGKGGGGGAGGADLDMDQVRRTVLGLLSPSPVGVDDVVQRSHFPASAVLPVLVGLELSGVVELLAGNRVCLLGAA